MRRVVVFSAVLFVVPACLFGASLDGFSGGTTPPPGSDASEAASAVPAAPPAAPDDAGADADAGFFCDRLHDPTPDFCADFDRGFPVSFDWAMEKSDVDEIALDPLSFEGPSSARLRRGAGGCTPLGLEHEVPSGAKTDVRIEMMVRPSEPAEGGVNSGYFGAVFLQAGNVGCSINLDRPGEESLGFKESALTADGGTGVYVSATRYPPIGVWSKLVLHFTLPDGGAGVVMNVELADGTALANAKLKTCRLGSTKLSIGPSCGSANGELRFDNVAVFVQ